MDWKKIAKGAALAAAGALAGYASTVIVPQLQESPGAVAIIAPLVSVALNVVRKWIADQAEPAK